MLPFKHGAFLLAVKAQVRPTFLLPLECDLLTVVHQQTWVLVPGFPMD